MEMPTGEFAVIRLGNEQKHTDTMRAELDAERKDHAPAPWLAVFRARGKHQRTLGKKPTAGGIPRISANFVV